MHGVLSGHVAIAIVASFASEFTNSLVEEGRALWLLYITDQSLRQTTKYSIAYHAITGRRGPIPESIAFILRFIYLFDSGSIRIVSPRIHPIRIETSVAGHCTLTLV